MSLLRNNLPILQSPFGLQYFIRCFFVHQIKSKQSTPIIMYSYLINNSLYRYICKTGNNYFRIIILNSNNYISVTWNSLNGSVVQHGSVRKYICLNLHQCHVSSNFDVYCFKIYKHRINIKSLSILIKLLIPI